VYYWTATLGVLCLLVVYAVAAAGVIVFTLRGKGNIAKWETIIPALAVVYLVYVFYKQSVGQPDPFNRLPYIAGVWCLIGLAIVVVAPGLARRIGDRLSAELAVTGSDVEEMEHQGSAREDLEPA
jgi:amino acid transporter